MEYLILILLIIFLTLVCIWGAFMVFMLIRTGVPFIPTKDEIVAGMLSAVKYRDNLHIYELGCGNGKLLFAIKKKCDNLKLENVRITGYELISPLVWWIKFKRKVLPQTTNKIAVFSRDFFRQDLSKADIIFCYLFPHLMQRISCEIFPKLRKGAILVSHAFAIDDLTEKEIIEVGGTKVYVYEK